MKDFNKNKEFYYVDRYAKANNTYMRDFIKNKELSCLKYWDVNNLYGWVMSQKFPVNGFKRVEDLSKFDKGFIKGHNKKIKKDIFWRLKFKIQKYCMNFIII